MNRLNKIILSCVLPFFCLLISVSYANIETDVGYYPYGSTLSTTAPISPFVDYTYEEIYDILYAYVKTPTDETVTAFNNICDYIDKSGYCIELIQWKNRFYGPWFEAYIFKKGDGELGIYHNISSKQLFVLFRPSAPTFDLCTLTSYGAEYYIKPNAFTDSQYYESNYIYSQHFSEFNDTPVIGYSNSSIKNMTYANSRYYWDGTYFYEYSDSTSEEEPTLPTNSEIAQAVQAFYNSDYYKNSTDFKDFIVMYNYKNQYFSFIGHNFGIDLGQVIIPPNYEYEGYSYTVDWWKFYLRNISSELASNLWNRNYWLYSTNDFGETLNFDGKGLMKELINLHFSTESIIVYSTTDYPVVKIEVDENGVFSPVEGTIPGDQYTYDETLDPTTNEYNPLGNFVPTDPTQSILGDVDFDEINKTFEENKDILDIENASWLFTANNQLINYFTGFISFLIVLVIISRLLGG